MSGRSSTRNLPPPGSHADRDGDGNPRDQLGILKPMATSRRWPDTMAANVRAAYVASPLGDTVMVAKFRLRLVQPTLVELTPKQEKVPCANFVG